MSAQTPAQNALLLDMGKRLRTALEKRAGELEKVMLEYDEASEGDDETKLQVATIMLLMHATLIDPVRPVIEEWGRMQATLKRVEAAVEGGS